MMDALRLAALVGSLAAAGPPQRLLLLLAPDPGDEALARQRALLMPHAAEMAERDLTVSERTGPEAATAAGQFGTSAGQFAAVQFGTSAGQFAAVLVGKDGGVKERWAVPVDVGTLAGLIDAMPMRRAEMGRRGK